MSKKELKQLRDFNALCALFLGQLAKRKPESGRWRELEKEHAERAFRLDDQLNTNTKKERE